MPCIFSERKACPVRLTVSAVERQDRFGNTSKQSVMRQHRGQEIGFGEIPYQEKQVMYLCADISDLEKDTGFAPRVTFAEGIEKTVDWCRKNYV